MEMEFENEHQAKFHSSAEGAACLATPDTALRQVADEHFKVRFRTFEIGSFHKFYKNIAPVCSYVTLSAHVF